MEKILAVMVLAFIAIILRALVTTVMILKAHAQDCSQMAPHRVSSGLDTTGN